MPAPAIPDVDRLEGFLGRVCRERLADHAGRGTDPGATTAPDHRFARALTGPALSLVAEVKRASPTGHAATLDALTAARAYGEGGASAVSVLTEPRHFHGDLDDLRAVASGQPLPAVRKDFVVHPAMILDARDAGASAVLLLVNALGDLTRDYIDFTHACGLDALVEVHTERELETALDAGARVIGVNNRDLVTLEVNTGTAPRVGTLARQDDFDGALVALSGYRDRASLLSLEGVFDAVLVGSSLAASGDLAAATRALLGRA